MPQIPNQKTQKVLSSDLKQNTYVFNSVVEKEARSRRVLFGVVIVVSVLLVGGSIFAAGVQNSKVSELNNQIRSKENKLKGVERKLKEVSQSKQKKINTLTQEVSRIQSEGITWSDVLDQVERITGANIILNKITGHYTIKDAQKEGVNTISLTGETNSYSALASYIEKIENEEYFSDVHFGSVSKTRRAGQPTRTGVKLSATITALDKEEDDGNRQKVGFAQNGDSTSGIALENSSTPVPVWDEGKMTPGTALSPESGSIHLEWKNADSALYYYVYGREAGQEEAPSLGTEDTLLETIRQSSGATTGYDIIVGNPLQEYEFVLKSQSRVGIMSAPSRVIKRTGGVVKELNPVQGVAMKREPRTPVSPQPNDKAFKEVISIAWEPVIEDDFYAYQVYMGTVKEDLNLVATIEDRKKTSFKKVFPYTKAELYARVVYIDRNGNVSE